MIKMRYSAEMTAKHKKLHSRVKNECDQHRKMKCQNSV